MNIQLTEKQKIIGGASFSLGLLAINRVLGVASIAFPLMPLIGSIPLILIGRVHPFSNLKKLESPATALTSLAVSNIFLRRVLGLSINKEMQTVINGLAIALTTLSLIKKMFCRMSRQ